MRRSLLIACALLLLISGLLAKQERAGIQKHRHLDSGKALSEMITQIRNSIVQIQATFPNGKSIGTGFFVGTEGIVVTARHVIYPIGNITPNQILVGISIPPIKSKIITMVASFRGF